MTEVYGVQQLIPEVADIFLDTEMERYSHPHGIESSPCSISDGSFAAEGTFADEIYNLQHYLSGAKHRLITAMRRYGGDFDFTNLTFYFYDTSIEIKGATPGWTPPDLLQRFLFKFAGFSCLYVCYSDGTESYWSAPAN